MARKKVKLAWITNDSTRRATCKKRKKGLMKKVSELSTLCGVDACVIVYCPDDSQPDVWPTPLDAHHVLLKFKSLPDMEQSKKMMSQEDFLRHRIARTKEQLRKQHKENRELEITQLMFQTLGNSQKDLYNVGLDDLNDLAWLLKEKMKDIQERIDLLKKNSTNLIPQIVEDNHEQQQQHGFGFDVGGGGTHQITGHENEEEKNGLDLTMEALRKESWFMDVMNSPEEMAFGVDDGGNEYLIPSYYGDSSYTWSNAFFP